MLEIDHSFKVLVISYVQIHVAYIFWQVVKHLGKQNGVLVFGALHSTTNEYNEIHSMVLTPTKAHNQYMPALATIPQSLKAYGHAPVELVFTDSVRADKTELENIFPSLPILDHSSYEQLECPPNWRITILSSSFQIESWLSSLMDDISNGEEMFVGMDMEWPVDQSSSIHGRVAVISIA